MTTISANDLKTRGVSLLEDTVSKDGEAIITLRGKSKYVVIDMPTYNRLREYELEAALAQTKRELKAGQFVKESVSKHMQRISRAI
jgi:PHD/YefM family antitoxin component YafN of YafNO toxin-antitoxin module